MTANLKLGSSYFLWGFFVLLLIVSPHLRRDTATDKDLLTTTAERHIRVSTTVVDTVTSSEAMNRHPNPVRCLSLCPVLLLLPFTKCIILDFSTPQLMFECFVFFFCEVRWSEDSLPSDVSTRRGAPVLEWFRACFPVSYDADLFRLWDTDGSAVVQVGRANFTATRLFLNRLVVQDNQAPVDWGNPFVLWLCLCSYI